MCSFVSHWRDSALFSELPASMDEMLASRFDSCSPDQQLLLRMAAVFGRSVDRRCMRRLVASVQPPQGSDGSKPALGALRTLSRRRCR